MTEIVRVIQSEWNQVQQQSAFGDGAAPFNEAGHREVLGSRRTEPWFGLIGTRNSISWDTVRFQRALAASDNNVSVEAWLESEG